MRRVNFDDLFDMSDGTLRLKRYLIILDKQYGPRDIVDDNRLDFILNPEQYFYIINPLQEGDTLAGYMVTN